MQLVVHQHSFQGIDAMLDYIIGTLSVDKDTFSTQPSELFTGSDRFSQSKMTNKLKFRFAFSIDLQNHFII